MSNERVGPHRKRVRHYHEPGHVHELTFSCHKRRPLLTNNLWWELLGESVDRAVEGHRYRLTAFVFMPEHVHLIVFALTDASRVDELLKAIKRPFSSRIKTLLEGENAGLLKTLTVRQRPGVTAFRFWQEGPGYDRNLTEPATTLSAIDYLHLNPVRRGLVERATDWRWSSARFYQDPKTPKDLGLPTVHTLPAAWWDLPER